jgi:hypothetical protein
MPGLSPPEASEAAHVMSKPAPTIYREGQTPSSFDPALSSMLDALRKPSKLTATLKRRALKNKVSRKSATIGPCRNATQDRDADGRVESTDHARRSRASHLQRGAESAAEHAEAMGLSQGAVDCRELGIDLGFHSGNSHENPKRYA